MSESDVDVLVRFARLAAEAGTGAAALPLLADALVEHVGADAVAVVEIRESGPVFVASKHTPIELQGYEVDIDAIGDELAAQLLDRCKGRFASVDAHPLVSGGGLFGSAVMFFAKGKPEPVRLSLAEGLVDLCAVSLDSSARLHALAESHARLRASQETLVKAERLRALGQMAAGVSHDLKNILNPLSLHLQLIDRIADKKKLDDVKGSIHEMRQVLTRGLQTIQRLRDYGRQEPESRSDEIDLNELAQEAIAIAKPRMASRKGTLNTIREELGQPSRFRGRSGDIVSALVNLLVNAMDAMPGGGAITVRTGSADGSAWVEVADEGPGMPPEVERRAFEPFFTTKGEEGTGLGLAMVYACMTRHDGTVKLATSDTGTILTLRFPVMPSPLLPV